MFKHSICVAIASLFAIALLFGCTGSPATSVPAQTQAVIPTVSSTTPVTANSILFLESFTLDDWNLSAGYSMDFSGMAWSSDSRLLAVSYCSERDQETSGCDRSIVAFWNPISGEIEQKLDEEFLIYGLDWSTDNQTLSYGLNNCKIKLWDTTSHKEIQELDGHQYPALLLKWSPDGKILASASFSEIYFWDTDHRTGEISLEDVFPEYHSINSMSWSPDGHMLATGGRDDSIYLWDVSTRELIGILNQSVNDTENIGDAYTPIAWSPDRKILATSNLQSIQLWDVNTGDLLGSSDPYEAMSISWSPDGSMIATSNGSEVSIWEPYSLSLITTLIPQDEFGFEPIEVVWSPDGHFLASVDGFGEVILWQRSE